MDKLYSIAVLVAIFFHSSICFSQTVSTLAGPGVNADDGMVVDNSGNVYVSRYSGSTVSKITPDGVISIFADGFDTPNGLEIDADGNIYVADALGNALYVVSQEGDIDTLVASMTNPSGLAFNASKDTLYVAQCSINRISRVALDGAVSTFISGNGLNCPVGLDFDSAGNLIVGNFTDGHILKIQPSGNVVFLAEIPPWLGFLTIVSDHIFATSFNGHQVYRITPSGEKMVFAGTGTVGNLDGPADMAQFNQPNGVAAAPSGDTLYISEWNPRSVRMIVGEIITDIDPDEVQIPAAFALEQNFPNPFNPTTVIRYTLLENSSITLEIYNMAGEKIRRLVGGNGRQAANQPAGQHAVTWDGTDDTGRQVASGVYAYRLSAGNNVQSKKMILLR